MLSTNKTDAVDLGNFAKGLYLVKVYSENKFSVKKIQVQFFTMTNMARMKRILDGNKIEQYFFQEKKKKLGTPIKEMENLTE